LRRADPLSKESYQMSKKWIRKFQKSNSELEKARGPNPNLHVIKKIVRCKNH